ncbi:unnamed protein product [Microthlaspi erraticum]|uniref:Late embryogenesis abundant protein LEA-2 subgroup domain-containing protein n=1 Tax=Microthlaspi erraticum TaxID=1685480 RepID=A0A6D2HLC8_9BRAS|nr:unnamed protein product [Microthlaspi erraticum]CAA7057656.1 unnamed protein product [Microthlaspi erraticum]
MGYTDEEAAVHNRRPSILECVGVWFISLCIVAGFIAAVVYFIILAIKDTSRKVPEPEIEIANMDFTALNITETRLSAEWDLSIRIPYDIPGLYICLQGDLQASFLYKNVTLATSSQQKYNNLKYNAPQVLKVSAHVSEEDIDGSIGKDIMKDMKEKKEVRFGTRFSLTDCSAESTGVMSYVCDEVSLRFEPGSEMKATLFGKHASILDLACFLPAPHQSVFKQGF